MLSGQQSQLDKIKINICVLSRGPALTPAIATPIPKPNEQKKKIKSN